MITRLYANNFRCLVAFEARFDSFGLLCGHNGSGKSSVFDVVAMLRDLASGDAVLGGEGPRDIPALELTGWLDSDVQEFEIDLDSGGSAFRYAIHLEQRSGQPKPRVLRESASCDGRILFERDLAGVAFRKPDGQTSGFPLDWRQAALGSIQPARDRAEIELLQNALRDIAVLRPNPLAIAGDSSAEAARPNPSFDNLVSWYRRLSQEQEWTDAVRDHLQSVWPDFRSFKLADVGSRAKALHLRFEGSPARDGEGVPLDRLSDGERMLVGLYMICTALETGALRTVLVDEPDNFVGLPELQPWILALRQAIDDGRQAILISHHPEILGSAGERFGRYMWRDNHASPARIGVLRTPPGLEIAEAVARGWVDAE